VEKHDFGRIFSGFFQSGTRKAHKNRLFYASRELVVSRWADTVNM
jgi:hypothetical protein